MGEAMDRARAIVDGIRESANSGRLSEIARVISECTDELFEHDDVNGWSYVRDDLPGDGLIHPGAQGGLAGTITDAVLDGWVQRTALAVSVLVDKLAREEEAGR